MTKLEDLWIFLEEELTRNQVDLDNIVYVTNEDRNTVIGKIEAYRHTLNYLEEICQ